MKITASLVIFFSASLSMAGTNCNFAKSIYNSGKIHFTNKQYLLGATHFSLITGYPCDSYLQDKAKFGYLLSLWKLEDTIEFDRYLNSISENIKSQDVKRKTLLLGAFLGKNMSAQGQLEESDRLKLKIWNARLNDERFEAIKKSFKKVDQIKLGSFQESYRNLQTKSPYVAGSLSLVPGLGQIYNGTYESAAVAFGLNLIFGLATSELYKKDLPAAGTASALVFSVTYFGNILSAFNGAKQINFYRENQINQKFEDHLFQFKPYQ